MKPIHGARRHVLGAGAAVALSVSAGGEVEAQQCAPSNKAASAGMATSVESGNLSLQDSIGDLLRHPALQGFSDHLLPWAGRAYDPTMRLSELGRLLPYHSEVRPGVMLDGINRIVQDSRAGKPVFHEIYSSSERRKDPTLDEAGLFFFAGEPGTPFAIIAPGGGFAYVASIHEGFPNARDISAKGLNAFVLTYRTGQGGRIAAQDLARAVDYVMTHAADLAVATEGYSLWGSSAGARMAAFIGSHGPRAFGARTAVRPATVVMAYTSHADVGEREPPTFVVVGGRDSISPPQTMRTRTERLRDIGTEVRLSEYSTLGHGFGTSAGTEAEGWIADAADFWTDHVKH